MKDAHPFFEDRHCGLPSAPSPLHSPSTWSHAWHVIYAWEIFMDWMNTYMNEWFLWNKLKNHAFIWCDPIWWGRSCSSIAMSVSEGAHFKSLHCSLGECFILRKFLSLWLNRKGPVDALAKWDLALREPLCLGAVARCPWKETWCLSLCVKAL